MSAIAMQSPRRESLWSNAAYKFRHDLTGMISLMF